MVKQYCESCNALRQFVPKERDVDSLGYNIEFCPDCHLKLACCISCPKAYKYTNHDTRSIRNHTRTHKNDVDDNVPPEDSDSDEDNESDDDSYGQRDQYLLSSDDSTSCSTNMEHQNFTVNEEDHYSFSFSKLEIKGILLPHYGNSISNTYFQQDYDLGQKNDELFGGIRGIAWQSRHRVLCATSKDILSLSDTEFMFDMTKLLSVNTEKIMNYNKR